MLHVAMLHAAIELIQHESCDEDVSQTNISNTKRSDGLDSQNLEIQDTIYLSTMF